MARAALMAWTPRRSQGQSGPKAFGGGHCDPRRRGSGDSGLSGPGRAAPPRPVLVVEGGTIGARQEKAADSARATAAKLLLAPAAAMQVERMLRNGDAVTLARDRRDKNHSNRPNHYRQPQVDLLRPVAGLLVPWLQPNGASPKRPAR